MFKGDVQASEWGILHNEELHGLLTNIMIVGGQVKEVVIGRTCSSWWRNK